MIDRTLLFDTRGGALRKVRVEDAGEESITAGGREAQARRCVVTGGLERELWYAPDGTWLQSRSTTAALRSR